MIPVHLFCIHFPQDTQTCLIPFNKYSVSLVQPETPTRLVEDMKDVVDIDTTPFASYRKSSAKSSASDSGYMTCCKRSSDKEVGYFTFYVRSITLCQVVGAPLMILPQCASLYMCQPLPVQPLPCSSQSTL